MKSLLIIRLSLVIFILLRTSHFYSQTIYVKQVAAGLNDGTSWQNAFTDLEAALAIASENSELWISAGNYHPGGLSPDTNSVFSVRHNLSIYGGFAGTETNLVERDPVLNLTILSGDINNDDITDDFTNNKSDNTRHVVYVDSLISLVIIDGLTIKGGHTSNNSNVPLSVRGGGGIYGLSPVNINNCKFTGNFGRSGGGILLTEDASHSSITRSSFAYNKTTDQGAGVYTWKISDIVISDCSFTDNQTVRGAMYPNTCTNVIVENCLFQDNHNTIFNGGALFSFQNIDLVVQNCEFIRNSAKAGGAIVINGGQVSTDSMTNVRIDNCSFLENIAEGSGGAILLTTCPDILISKCEFKSDSAKEGGGIYIDQPQNYITDINDIRIDSCLFEKNKSGGKGGGALFMRYTSAKVEHSLFDGNTTNALDDGGGGQIFQNCPGEYIIYRDISFRNGHSLGYGGATTSYGIDAQYLFEGCHFSNNSSERGGGAQHGGSEAKFIYKNCMFTENVSKEPGGAISGFQNSNLVVNQCQFSQNSALSGGAIYIIQPENNLTDTNNITIDSCLFKSNVATNSGGAMLLKFASAKIEHCIFEKDTANGFAGAGGGGHVYHDSPGEYIIYRDVSFKNGQSMLNGGAALARGKEAHYLFESCEFNNNHANWNSGAVGNSAHSIYSKCIFLENSSDSAGGALSLIDDSTSLHIINSVFDKNVSAASGAIASSRGSNSTTIDHSEFYANKSTVHCGVVTVLEDEGLEIGTLQVSNSLFGFNETSNFAGVFDVRAAETEITNSVFYENTCTGPVGGGVFYFFTLNNATMKASLINNTIVDNHGVVGDGLVLSTTDTASFLTTTLQNCIFRNKGVRNYVLQAGQPILISKGGNMSDDLSMSDELNHTQDLNITEPIFSDPNNYDFSLVNNSAGIDAGVFKGAPEFDILGNPRVNAPDMGAYENQFPVGVKETKLLHEGSFVISPNPASGKSADIVMNNSWIGPLEVKIISLSGATLNVQHVYKPSENYRFKISLDAISPGVYQVIVSNGEEVELGKLIRI